MYTFGMMALLGLAVLVVAKIGNRYLRLVPGAWAFALVALGVGAAWLVSLNLFSAWSISVRNSEIAVTATGVRLAGAAYFWREILGQGPAARAHLPAQRALQPCSPCRVHQQAETGQGSHLPAA
jgi:hypothetical protein